MKQKRNFYVYNSVLTYFKDVFDGTSPFRGRSRLYTPHFIVNSKTEIK